MNTVFGDNNAGAVPRKITLRTLSMMSRCGISLEQFLSGSIDRIAELVWLLCAPEDEVSRTVYREPQKLAERADAWLEQYTPAELTEISKRISDGVAAMNAVQVVPDERGAEKNG